VNEAADGAGDEELTPSEIASMIRSARAVAGAAAEDKTARYLDEALDAVSDGMPADYVARILYAALGASQGA
jgi:hypothetical protein